MWIQVEVRKGEKANMALIPRIYHLKILLRKAKTTDVAPSMPGLVPLHPWSSSVEVSGLASTVGTLPAMQGLSQLQSVSFHFSLTAKSLHLRDVNVNDKAFPVTWESICTVADDLSNLPRPVCRHQPV